VYLNPIRATPSGRRAFGCEENKTNQPLFLKKDRPRILNASWNIPENNMGGGLLLPETERVAARVIVLPTGQTVKLETVARICEVIRNVAQ
jgi:dTDP-4-amino-4,6-dideoxygalactose transaminase